MYDKLEAGFPLSFLREQSAFISSTVSDKFQRPISFYYNRLQNLFLFINVIKQMSGVVPSNLHKKIEHLCLLDIKTEILPVSH